MCKADNPKWKPTESKDGHEWGFYGLDNFQCCRICGFIRRRDDANKPCGGLVKITLRKENV